MEKIKHYDFSERFMDIFIAYCYNTQVQNYDYFFELIEKAFDYYLDEIEDFVQKASSINQKIEFNLYFSKILDSKENFFVSLDKNQEADLINEFWKFLSYCIMTLTAENLWIEDITHLEQKFEIQDWMDLLDNYEYNFSLTPKLIFSNPISKVLN